MQRESSAPETIVATIGKNSLEDVVISFNEYRGSHLLDVRTFSAFAGKEKRATKKGISLKVERLPELIAALQTAEAEAARLGLLEGGVA
jgi:hypothetical protein